MTSPIERLDWDDLRIFLDVARVGSLTQAARALKVDHSTVSRRLTRLEYAVGATLFERGRGGVTLTEMGVAVMRRAEELAAGIGQLRADVSGSAATGLVRLATMEGIASLWLTPRLRALQERAPDVRLELVTSSQQVRVNRREADLFLSFFRPTGRNLISSQLGAFTTHLWASPGYLARAGTPGTLDDLARHDFVGYIEEFVLVDAVRWLEELVPDPRLVFTSNSMISQLGAARGGVGIVCLPSFSGAEQFGLVKVLANILTGRRDLWLTVHTDLASAPRIRAFTDTLRALIDRDDAFSSCAEVHQ
ncbi:LysR family transcriptional regulator [Bradyrhizobium sp. Arg237L]|uniref:LysR family transcriptional regulator n=1 Tax=Bradyrhizobium sp. Arg237L TaxID=3003352 RepID=UPI00249E7EE6|nr:LysR family transcriptional regulator [Bradyrhizobium sp. Arg237L]MDI4237137.1 LysR family transcriptional regulator [Bradyrhizobium sp. Arg237L]